MIEKLFDDGAPYQNPACRAAREEVLAAESALQAALPQTGFPMLERFSDAHAKLDGLLSLSAFTEGFRAALTLTAELKLPFPI